MLELLEDPKHHRQVCTWLAKNLGHDNPLIRSVAAKVLEGGIVSAKRSGPKLKADQAYKFAAWQIAVDLKEIGLAMHHGEPTGGLKLTAARVIANAAGISISLARDWISEGQKLYDE